MEQYTSDNLGVRVKQLRIKMGLTQNQVAQALNVTPGYISNVENSRTAMSLRVLTFYAKLVGITLDSLVGSMEPEYAQTALDNDIKGRIERLTEDQKKKLIKTLDIWLDVKE